jgi:hypothetical protein
MTMQIVCWIPGSFSSYLLEYEVKSSVAHPATPKIPPDELLGENARHFNDSTLLDWKEMSAVSILEMCIPICFVPIGSHQRTDEWFLYYNSSIMRWTLCTPNITDADTFERI